MGQRARDELDADLYSGLLELHLDGPQTETEMFTCADGVLLLTDFSRACAQQWVLQHGRRFTCYKVRKDKACRRPERKKGTDRAVQLLARAAYKTQCDMATEDAARASTLGREPARQTVFGKDRAKLMEAVRRLAKPAPGKKTVRFRLATVAKRAEKHAAETWCGWGSKVPKPRLGGSAAVEAATRSAATQAVRAKMWMSARRRNAMRMPSETLARASTPGASTKTSTSTKIGRQVLGAHDGVAVNAGTWKRRSNKAPTEAAPTGTRTTASAPTFKIRPKRTSASTLAKSTSASTPAKSTSASTNAFMYKAMAAKYAKKNEHVINTSLETLVKQRVDPDTTVLTAWLKAITQGGLVRCEGKRMALQPGVQTGCHVQLSPQFAERHGSLANAMRKTYGDKPMKGAHHISKMRDVAAFLLHARRVAVASEASGLARSF